MANEVYLGLGSNKGDRTENIKNAINELNSAPECKVKRCSFLYETEPYGLIKQDNFYNAACLCETDLSLLRMFETIKNIEKKLGRLHSERWGPREIDIDILLYNDLIYTDERLTVPHKELFKRDFVILPLLDLNPDLVHPGLKIKLNSIRFSKKYILNRIETNLLKTVGD